MKQINFITFLQIIALMLIETSTIAATNCREVRIDENFETRELKDWEIITVGGKISLDAGYAGKGVVVIRSNPGGDNFTRIQRELPIAWAGKTIKVEAMVKYNDITPGRKTAFHHAGHIDFEAFTSANPEYPVDWGRFVGTSNGWQPWSAEWEIPANAQTVVFRLGLQGASGTISFDNIKIYLCE